MLKKCYHNVEISPNLVTLFGGNAPQRGLIGMGGVTSSIKWIQSVAAALKAMLKCYLKQAQKLRFWKILKLKVIAIIF